MQSKEEFYIYYGVISFLTIEYLWELYLAIRQHRVYEEATELPTDLEDIMTPETYKKARVYNRDQSSFRIMKDLFAFIVTCLVIYVDGFVIFWKAGGQLAASLGSTGHSETLQTIGFALLMNLFNTLINMPFSVYHTFVVEERHGFNKQTAGFFIKDKIKEFLVGQAIMLPLFAAIIWIVRIGGTYFFIYLWVFAMMFSLFLLTIYPNYIMPLFDRYTPLSPGSLRTRIEELAASVKFPLYKLYVVEGSKRSNHSNAFFYGFFKNKRIVLFDTLLKDYKSESEKDTSKTEKSEEKESEKKESEKVGCDDDEVLAVLGHELGHWKLNHVIKTLVCMQVNLFLVFLVFGLLFQFKPMYAAFGFRNEQPVIIGLLIVLQFIFSPYHAILNFSMTILSRHHEFQADKFARDLGKAKYLRSALIKLSRDNLSFPVYDWLYSRWHYSHPPLLERLAALDKTD
ncbi:CAAX prenyl protease 1-like protein [Gryllus bimaculatus]|nr:CAAX prenyl protease 1-like protein [Gryllus bimaculatus]